MILQSISLHNFMSYADARLDLSTVSVACLCGNNGAGKSALLDATTWAIWEEARANSDELVRHGQKEMWVDVVFLHEGNTYRIRRSRQKTPSRSGNKANTKGTLDLQMLGPNNAHQDDLPGNGKNNGNNDWKSLTANSTKETQQKICQLLRMDYLTFVNSAYLKQGAADEFARKAPADRKKILGEILGLSYFERLQERCKDKLRPLKEKCEWLTGILSSLPEIEERIKQLEIEQNNIQSHFENARAQKEKNESQLVGAQRKQHELLSWQEKQKSIKAQLITLESEIEKLSQQKEDFARRFDSLKILMDDQDGLESELSHFETTTATLKELDEKAFSAQGLEKQKTDLRNKLSQERSKLELDLAQAEKERADFIERQTKLRDDVENQHTITEDFKQYQNLIGEEENLARRQESYTQIKNRIGELQTAIDEAQIRLSTEIEQKAAQLANLKSLVDSQTMLEKQRADLEAKEVDLDKKEQEFQFVAEKGQDIKGQIESISRQMAEEVKRQQEYANKIEELNQCTDSTICPLCSGPIIDRQAVVKHYQDMIAQSKSEVINLENEQIRLEEQRNSLRQKYSELNNELGQRKDLDKQIGQFKEKLRAIKEASETKEKLAEEVEQLQAQDQRNDYATVQRVSLVNLTNELNELQFDPILYANIQAQIRSQRGIEPRYYQLQRDLAELNKIEAALPELFNKIESVKVIMDEESYGDIVRDTMRLLDQQLQEVNYDRDLHDQLRGKLTALMPKVEKYKDIKRAMSEMPIIEKNLKDAQSWLSDKTEQKNKLAREHESATNSADELSHIKVEISQLEQLVIETRHSYELLVQEQAKVNANLERSKGEISNLQKQKKSLVTRGWLLMISHS